MFAIFASANIEHVSYMGITYEAGVMKLYGVVQELEDEMLLKTFMPNMFLEKNIVIDAVSIKDILPNSSSNSLYNSLPDSSHNNLSNSLPDSLSNHLSKMPVIEFSQGHMESLQLYPNPIAALNVLYSVLSSRPGNENLNAFVKEFLYRLDVYGGYIPYCENMSFYMGSELAKLYWYTNHLQNFVQHNWPMPEEFLIHTKEILFRLSAGTLLAPFGEWEFDTNPRSLVDELRPLYLVDVSLSRDIVQEEFKLLEEITNDDLNKLLIFVGMISQNLFAAQKEYNACYEKYAYYKSSMIRTQDSIERAQKMKMLEQSIVVLLRAQAEVYKQVALIKKYQKHFVISIEYLNRCGQVLESIRQHKIEQGLTGELSVKEEQDAKDYVKLAKLFDIFAKFNIDAFILSLQNVRTGLIDDYTAMVEEKISPDMPFERLVQVLNMNDLYSINNAHFGNVILISGLLDDIKKADFRNHNVPMSVEAKQADANKQVELEKEEKSKVARKKKRKEPIIGEPIAVSQVVNESQPQVPVSVEAKQADANKQVELEKEERANVERKKKRKEPIIGIAVSELGNDLAQQVLPIAKIISHGPTESFPYGAANYKTDSSYASSETSSCRRRAIIGAHFCARNGITRC